MAEQARQGRDHLDPAIAFIDRVAADEAAGLGVIFRR